MGGSKRLMLLVTLVLVQPTMAATKYGDRPDREMLRMMEFLREMEMIKQMEMMEEMKNLQAPGDPVREATTQKSAPTGKKEATR